MNIVKLTEVTKPSIEHPVDVFPMGPRIIFNPRRQRVVYLDINEISYARLSHFSIMDANNIVDAFDYWEIRTKSGERLEVLKDELSDKVFP